MSSLFPPSYHSISKRIRQVRGGLSQTVFGARIGITQTAVTALENALSEPRLSTFSRIVEEFGVDPEWLRTGSVAVGATGTAARSVLDLLKARKASALRLRHAAVLMELEIIADELGLPI